MSRRPRRLGLAALPALTLLAACGPGTAPDDAERATPASDWEAVLAEAEGQTVDWYMYGGDQRLNRLVRGVVRERLADLGVELRQVRVSDTAEALDTVLGEVRAGRTTGGSVDAIWVNGENFATGVQADLWRCDWAGDLPNARYVDLDSPAVATDFGVPTRGCEAAWQQASSALVYDGAALDDADVASLDALLAWAEQNPGRFTYAAPPDFTGSMAVRTLLYDTVGPGSVFEALGVDGAGGGTDGGGTGDQAAQEVDEDAYAEVVAPLWQRLRAVEPALWRGGETYPQSQEQVEKLYADGEISAFLTYGPGAIGSLVADGVFPPTTREAVPSVGNISNVSFVAVPRNAADQAGALVLANVLQEPEVQLALLEGAGIYPAVELDRLPSGLRRRFAEVTPGPAEGSSVLGPEELTADALPELPAAYIDRIEEDWEREVLQR